MGNETVLVTGGTGFLGAHCILKLLDEGYRVRTTVRSSAREADVRAMLKVGGAEPGERLSFAVADLTSDAGWAEAVAGCRYVLHVASPFGMVSAKRADEMIVPAREGTLRVLRAARDAEVKRVVLTSSSEAVVHDGRPPSDLPYTEENWSDPSAGMSPYGQSKVLAEKAAWDFLAREGGDLELAVVNPVGIYGPVLGPDLSTSVDILAQLLARTMPRLPRMAFDIVDVRDAADLHCRAMTHPAARGQRFLASTGLTSLEEIARLLKARLGPAAAKVPTKTMPDWVLKLAGLVVPELSQVGSYLGKPRKTTSEKARRLLGWSPRPIEGSILATAESLVALGLVPK